jgi:hypothetical protein
MEDRAVGLLEGHPDCHLSAGLAGQCIERAHGQGCRAEPWLERGHYPGCNER